MLAFYIVFCAVYIVLTAFYGLNNVHNINKDIAAINNISIFIIIKLIQNIYILFKGYDMYRNISGAVGSDLSILLLTATIPLTIIMYIPLGTATSLLFLKQIVKLNCDKKTKKALYFLTAIPVIDAAILLKIKNRPKTKGEEE